MKLQSILGKLLFLLLPFALNAQVSVSLDRTSAYKDDLVQFIIEVNGNDIIFPNINTIGTQAVIGTSTSSQLRVINGAINRSKTVSYSFKANQSMKIPSFKVELAGVIEYTDELFLQVLKPNASKIGDTFQLQLFLSKKTAYLGESIIANLQFKYKIGTSIVDANLAEFAPKHFYIKTLQNQDTNPKQENGYMVYNNNFLIFPQQAGILNIESQIINVAKRQAKTNFIVWEKIFSKVHTIEVLPLAQGIDIQGEYVIEASVDKQSTKANEPVKLPLKIMGTGNIDDIDEINIDSSDTVNFSTKPTITNYMKNNNYGGEFTQKFSFIGEKDFIIPYVSFKYFDIKTKKIKELTTQEFSIKVKKNSKTNQNIQTNNKVKVVEKIKIVVEKEDAYIKYVLALVSFLLGAALVYFLTRKKKVLREDTPIIKKIKTAKTDKELYNILLAFGENNEIAKIISRLEDNIYNNKQNKINKKEIIEILSQKM
jgi:hypothetical protein